MRRYLALMAAVAVLSACTPVAEGAPAAGGSPASPSASPAPSTSPSPASRPVPSTTARLAGSTPATPMPDLTASPAPSAPPTPSASPTAPGAIDPALLGGPAPVGSFVLGDSISLSPRIGPLLGRYGYPVVGLVGQSVSGGYLTTHLRSPAAQDAPAWVIELGTNNSGSSGDVARLEGWVDLIDSLRTPGDRQRVLWVTPYRPVSSDARTESALDDFNAELARLAAQRPWLRLIDFAAVAKAHTEWFDQDGALHVHPDEDGQGALVAMIAGPDAVPADTPMPVINAAPPAAPAPSPVATVAPEDQVFDNSAG